VPLRIVDDVSQLKVGTRVIARKESPTSHAYMAATVLGWDKWGGSHGIKEAVWIRFDCGCFEHRSPGSLYIRS
jgi:hypothetical protein